MRLQRLCGLVVLGRLVLLGSALAQGGVKPRGGTTPATATFREPALGFDGDRVDSDGKGTYINKVDRAKVYLQSGAHYADFVLDLVTTKGVRELFVDFGDCAAAPCSPPFAQDTVFYNTVLQTRRANLPAMEVGETTAARLHLGFWAPDETGENVAWAVRFDPLDTSTGCEDSSTVALTRVDASTWVIEADLNDVACLAALRNSLWELRGKYRLPLQVTVKLK